MTIEIGSAQDVNSNNPPTNEPIQGIETPQIAGSIHRSEPLQVAGSIHGTETLETTVSIHGTENLKVTVSTGTGTKDDFIKSITGWVMTVATILMGMAFQSGMNIPGGYWSETRIKSSSASIDSSNDTRHTAGQPIIMNMDRYRYIAFLILNIAAFGTSMSVILLLLFQKNPKHAHGLLSIRWLLVYAMVMIAAVYALGCAPQLDYAVKILCILLFFMVLVYNVWLIWRSSKYFVAQSS